jgi:hypothetical protein
MRLPSALFPLSIFISFVTLVSRTGEHGCDGQREGGGDVRARGWRRSAADPLDVWCSRRGGRLA